MVCKILRESCLEKQKMNGDNVWTINDQLRTSASSGSIVEVEHCLSKTGCDPWSKDNGGVSALMLAAIHGHESCVSLLLLKSDPLAMDDRGRSALMWAAINGHEKCMEVLLPVSNPLAVDELGLSALMYAAISGHGSCVRFLLPHSDISARDRAGRSVSEIARRCSHPALAEMIDAFTLSFIEATELSADILPAPPRGTSARRV